MDSRWGEMLLAPAAPERCRCRLASDRDQAMPKTFEKNQPDCSGPASQSARLSECAHPFPMGTFVEMSQVPIRPTPRVRKENRRHQNTYIQDPSRWADGYLGHLDRKS